MSTHFVYILYSSSKDQFYKGHTSDISDRLKRHNAGQELATKHGVPWKLLWVIPKSSRSEAAALEAKLKNLSRSRTVQFMLKYSEGVGSPDELLLIQQLSGC